MEVAGKLPTRESILDSWDNLKDKQGAQVYGVLLDRFDVSLGNYGSVPPSSRGGVYGQIGIYGRSYYEPSLTSATLHFRDGDVPNPRMNNKHLTMFLPTHYFQVVLDALKEKRSGLVIYVIDSSGKRSRATLFYS